MRFSRRCLLPFPLPLGLGMSSAAGLCVCFNDGWFWFLGGWFIFRVLLLFSPIRRQVLSCRRTERFHQVLAMTMTVGSVVLPHICCRCELRCWFATLAHRGFVPFAHSPTWSLYPFESHFCRWPFSIIVRHASVWFGGVVSIMNVLHPGQPSVALYFSMSLRVMCII